MLIFKNLESGVFGGMLAYVLQLYMDFVGCMDIVLGTAQCLGITMVENFDRPFSSTSIQEFWRRWHITLGLWLRDYIMYPLLRSNSWNKLSKWLKKHVGKKSAKTIPTYLAMLVLWVCMGLWHGGGWNFIFQGIWFWFVIVLGQISEPLYQPLIKKIPDKNKFWICLLRIRTLLIFMIGTVFFRAESVHEGFSKLANIFTDSSVLNFNLSARDLFSPALLLKLDPKVKQDLKITLTALVGAFIGWTIWRVCVHVKNKKKELLNDQPVMVYVFIYTLIIWTILIIGQYGVSYSATNFIYGGF